MAACLTRYELESLRLLCAMRNRIRKRTATCSSVVAKCAMSLLLLPAELKLNIIELLDPASTLHLALSSKAQYNLCEDRLREHATLFEQHSVIRPSDDDEYLIWDITKEILEDPSKGWYVRELDLISDRREERQEMPDEDRSLFIAAAERLKYLYSCEMEFFATDRYEPREWVDMMVEDINSGFEDPILVLLVHHLPWLHTFRMTDRSMTDAFQVFMRRVAAGYQNPAMALQMPLQHLRLAAVAHNDTENHCSVDWAVYFVCIPSLKTFTAFMMGSEEIGQYDEHQEAHLRTIATGSVSNVEELIFNGCQFDPESFDTLLPLIKNLKRFEYDAGGHIVAETQDVEPRKVIRALLAHAGHSLEELSLAEVSVNCEVCAQKNASPDWILMNPGFQRGRRCLSSSQRLQNAQGFAL